MEVEMAFLESLLEAGNELAAEDATEHVDGKKESIARLNPVCLIERQPTGRNDAMDVGVKPELLTPGV